MSEITISTGNRKIKNCNIFNLPVGLTCKKGVKCAAYCYSKKAERTYPGVRPSRMANYKASKKKSFVRDINLLLRKSKYKITRIHEGGDFYSVDYIRKWFMIADLNRDHKFYAYTKRDDLFTPQLLEVKPPNLTLIFSVDGILKDDTMYAVDKHNMDKVAAVFETKTNCPSTHKDGWKNR